MRAIRVLILTIILIAIIFFYYPVDKKRIEGNNGSDNDGDNGDNGDSFERTKIDFKSGNYLNILNISKEYYTRPDFYYTKDKYEKYWDKNLTKRGKFGYGAYPGEVSYNTYNFKTGQYLDVYTFVHSSYEVYTYQGLKLIFKSPDTELFETYTDPSEILLYPAPNNVSEPKENWTYLVKMTVVAKKDIPEGRYVFKLEANIPSEDKRIEYFNRTKDYVDGGIFLAEKFFDFVLYTYNNSYVTIRNVSR